LLPFLEERGQTEQYAKFLLSTIAIVSTAGRVVTGLFLDRFETPKTAILVYLSLLVGLILVDYGPLGVVFTAVLIIGFGVGAEGGGIIGYFIARYFGLRSFAEITGYNFTAALIALGIGPVVVGRLYTMTGSYHIAFIVLDTALALTIACVFLLGPYVYDLKPPRRGDRRG
jgi:cyanate permease